jgi:hypothetical protein
MVLKGIVSLVEYLFWRPTKSMRIWFKTLAFKEKINMKFLLNSSKALASYKIAKEFRINKWFYRNKQKLYCGFPSQSKLKSLKTISHKKEMFQFFGP